MVFAAGSAEGSVMVEHVHSAGIAFVALVYAWGVGWLADKTSVLICPLAAIIGAYFLTQFFTV